ncbi:hypothetical protein [Streptomyces sp. NPDC059063]|uniref:hypothetical protein n=1 Tax=unclassified Streptomyces TaxID=2593676 RepID=UPI003692630B
MAYVSRPGTANARHEVTVEQLADHIARTWPRHPQLRAFLAAARDMAGQRRRYVRAPGAEVGVPPDAYAPPSGPYADTDSGRTVPADADPELCALRAEVVFAEAAELAERAGLAALKEAGISADDLGGILTFQGRGVAAPGHDTHLVDALGIPGEAARMPLATTGGAHAIGLAAALVRPGRPLLVVGVDVLGAAHARGNDHLNSMLHRLLLADGAAAAVVSAEPLTRPGLFVEDGWSYVHPGADIDHQLRAHEEGFHFDAPQDAAKAVACVLARLPWRQGAEPLDFALVHPGGPHYLDAVVDSGLCPNAALRHARATLAEDGDTGGSAVLRVLARTYDDPPPVGARGLLLGVGPGMCGAASPVRWG